MYESERKAPNIGMKFDTAFQMNKTLVAVTLVMWYSKIKYKIIFAPSPVLATFSNASFAARKQTNHHNMS